MSDTTAVVGGGDELVPLLLGMDWHEDRHGGLNKYLADLMAALRSIGVDAKAVLAAPATGAPSHVTVAGAADEPLALRLRNYRVAAERRAADTTVVDAHFALYACWPVVLGRLRGHPLVVHFQGPWADESAVSRGESRVVVGLKRLVERSVYRRASVAITLSAAFKQILVERYGVSPWAVRVIPPGVDLSCFRQGDRSDARSRLGLSSIGPLVVAVRRLERRMGLDVLLQAWAEVHPETPDSHLLIIGDGPYRAVLEKLAVRLGVGSSTQFLTQVDAATLVSCYQAADLTVVPSTALEGFGLVVLESLACGTPVLVTDTGGLPEAVQALDPGSVMPAGDRAALATGLRQSMTDTTARPSADQCRRHAEAHDWETIARRHVQIYADAISPPTPQLRVVYLDHCARLSGGELALLTLLPALEDVNAHVILAEDGPLVSRLLRRGVSAEILPLADAARAVSKDRVRLGSLPAGSMIQTARYVVRLALRLRRLRPDIVHANSLKAGLYGGLAARLAGIPFVWHVRDRIASDYLPGGAARLVRAMASVLPVRIVVDSQTALETLGPSARRAVIIPSPGQLDSRPGPLRRDPDAPFRVGMIGRLAPWKGQHVFLDAFAEAFPNGPEQACIVGAALFGEEQYVASLRTRASTLGMEGRVEFRGFREDIVPELEDLDVVVHASVTPEPFGQIVVEAMAAGRPVVAADAGGPAEVLEHGVNGLLYPPGDAAALAGCLRRLATDQDLGKRLATAGLSRAKDFAVEKISDDIMAMYRDVRDATSAS